MSQQMTMIFILKQMKLQDPLDPYRQTGGIRNFDHSEFFRRCLYI